MKRLYIKDIKVVMLTGLVEGILEVHTSFDPCRLEPVGSCIITCNLRPYHSISASRLADQKSLPELTDEEWEIAYNMIRSYAAGVAHETSLCSWIKESKLAVNEAAENPKSKCEFGIVEEVCPFCGQDQVVLTDEHYYFCPYCCTLYTYPMIKPCNCGRIGENSPSLVYNGRSNFWTKPHVDHVILYNGGAAYCSKCNGEVDILGW